MRYVLLLAITSISFAQEFKEPDWDARYQELYQHYYRQHQLPSFNQEVTVLLNIRSPLKKDSIKARFIQLKDETATLKTDEDPEAYQVPRDDMMAESRQLFFPKDYAHYKAYRQVQEEKAQFPAKLAEWNRQQLKLKQEEAAKLAEAERQEFLKEDALRRAEQLRRRKIAQETKTGTVFQVIDSSTLFLNYKPDPQSYKTILIAVKINDTSPYVIDDVLTLHLKEDGVYIYESTQQAIQKIRQYKTIEVLNHIKP